MQKELLDDKLESQSKESDATILGEGESLVENPNAANNTTAAVSDIAKASKNNVIIIVAALALGALALIYFLYYKNKPQQESGDGGPFSAKKQPARSQDIPMPSLSRSDRPDTGIAIAAPPPPPQEKKVDPQPPAPPPLPKLPDLPKADSTPAPPALPKIDASQQNTQSRQDAKIKSSIMLTGGGGSSVSTQGSGTSSKSNPISAATAAGNFVPDLTSATSNQVTTVGDLSITITQGKILDAVLETPVNTNYQGPIRALVSRDVYSDKGSNILIPRGSRLIGTLKGGYTPGMTRVMIDWNRIIMPSGYDVSISGSPAMSPSGMVGVEGYIDRQFLETLGTTAMLSVINIGMAKIIQDKFNIQPVTQQTDRGSSAGSGSITTTTTNLTPTQQTAQNELQNLSDATTNWLKQNFIPTPYIVIDQGTRVKVFVNQDIRFPKNLNTNISMVR